MPVVWACLGIYVAWYFGRAKHYSPISAVEAKQLWKIHTQDVQCNGKKWQKVKRGRQIVGFECECGHKHVQKRPIAAHGPVTTFNSKVSTFDRIHTSHKSS
jgi:hypothetical protein